jgi:hypothetical protein
MLTSDTLSKLATCISIDRLRGAPFTKEISLKFLIKNLLKLVINRQNSDVIEHHNFLIGDLELNWDSNYLNL